jgi:two-component sensor histidine kinase
METLRKLCLLKTSLGEDEITKLEQLASMMQYIADLTGSDIFLDCMHKDSQTAFVAAEAKPGGDFSAYKKTVLGQDALPENEPAVYSAFQTGMSVRDLKAITQENKSVKQDVTPVKGENGDIIAVLIKEKDISSTILNEKKFRQLAKEMEEKTTSILGLDSEEGALINQEIHHRIKNNLQMVASILSLQARKTDSPQVRRAFNENIGRVLSIASIHDILTKNDAGDTLDLKPLIEKICRNIQSIAGGGRAVSMVVEGDDLAVNADKGTAIALAVNELITNALEHGFSGRKTGNIKISVRAGNHYSTIEVQDDGSGFDLSDKKEQSLGLDLVTLTVRDKLKGDLRMESSPQGTKALFDFKL